MGRRIMCCGPSGTGKTTLAKWISEEFKIPFLETSTKPLWKEWNVSSHKEILVKSQDQDWAIAFQDAVLEYRLKLMEGQDNYVCDRSFIDNIAYYLLQVSAFTTQEQSDEYIRKCLKGMTDCTHLIIFPMVLQKVPSDGMRIDNPYYQITVDSIIQAILMRKDYPIYQALELNNRPKQLIMNVWDMEVRKQAIYKMFVGLHKA